MIVCFFAQVKNLLVMPQTKALRRPLVEVLADQFTGPATVFVSHAYSYDVLDSIEVMLRYEEAHPGSYFWFDPFSLNQHGDNGVVDTAVLEVAFASQIESIGATLIVASPWDNPAFLARAWCLFELLTSTNVGVPITILLPHKQHSKFLLNLKENFQVGPLGSFGCQPIELLTVVQPSAPRSSLRHWLA